MIRHALPVLFPLVLACGGSNGNGTTPSSTGNLEFDTTLCEQIPYYEVNGQTCNNILIAMDRTMDAARACNVDADCQAISGQCQSFPASGTCWYPVNLCDDPVPPWPDDIPSNGWAELDRFISAWNQQGCDFQSGPCPGCGSRPAVGCVDGECTCLEGDCAEP